MNGGTLEVRFSAPRENIIRVSVTHFKGAVQPGPCFETFEEPVRPEITITDECACLRSGSLTVSAVRAEGRWLVEFTCADGRKLTSSGYHGRARALLEEAGPSSLQKHGKS